MNDNASCPRVVLVQSLVGLSTYIYVAIRIVWFDALVSSWIGEIEVDPSANRVDFGSLGHRRIASIGREVLLRKSLFEYSPEAGCRPLEQQASRAVPETGQIAPKSSLCERVGTLVKGDTLILHIKATGRRPAQSCM